MKVLVIDDRFKVPSCVSIVHRDNWKEFVQEETGNTSDCRFFCVNNFSFDVLLKFIEEYKGNLAMYIDQGEVSPMLYSRFTKVSLRKNIPINKSFGIKQSQVEKDLSVLKSKLY